MQEDPLAPEASPSPQVSVVVPCYNAERYVAETLDSILRQEGVSYEIVAVNDGSTDDTAKVLERYGDRIRVVSQANGGLSAARNAGAAASRGEALAFLDSDDLLLPGALAHLHAALSESGRGVAYGEAIAIDGEGKPITGRPMGYRSPEGDTLRALCAGTLFQPSAGMVRRDLFERVGGFDTSLNSVEDLDFQYRCAVHTEFAKLDDPVLYYRINPTSMTRNYPRMIERSLEVHQDHARRLGLWRRHPREVLAGRLKAAFYFCSEHLESRGRRSPEMAAAARRSMLRHPWVPAMLLAMPALRAAKRAAVAARSERKPTTK